MPRRKKRNEFAWNLTSRFNFLIPTFIHLRIYIVMKYYCYRGEQTARNYEILLLLKDLSGGIARVRGYAKEQLRRSFCIEIAFSRFPLGPRKTRARVTLVRAGP